MKIKLIPFKINMNFKIIQCNFLQKYNNINNFNCIFKNMIKVNTYITQNVNAKESAIYISPPKSFNFTKKFEIGENVESLNISLLEDKFFTKYQKVLLIDIENIGKYKFSGFDGIIIGFISNNSSLYKKLNDIKRYIHLEIFNGKEKNGADILMSIFIGQNLNNFKNYNNKIIILTKDKFGLAIKNICNQNGIECIIKHNLDENI